MKVIKSRRKWRKQHIPSRVTFWRVSQKLRRRIERSPFLETFVSSYRSLLLHGSSSFVVTRRAGRAVVRSLDPTDTATRITGHEASVIVVDDIV